MTDKPRAFIGIDPATSTGFAGPHGSGVWDLSPLKAAVKKGRLAEPEFVRPFKMWQHLEELHREYISNDIVMIVEGAAGFSRGKAAVRVGHEIRGVIKAWCCHRKARYVEVAPNALKEFAGGRSGTPKEEMVEIAKKKYKADLTSDDEADALHLKAWGETNYKL